MDADSDDDAPSSIYNNMQIIGQPQKNTDQGGLGSNSFISFSQNPKQQISNKELSVRSGGSRKLKKDKIYKREDVWHFDQEMTDEQFL